jgi:hypothetical protein
MPRYLKVTEVPQMLEELQGLDRGAPYQLNKWQQKWCAITEAHEEVINLRQLQTVEQASYCQMSIMCPLEMQNNCIGVAL